MTPEQSGIGEYIRTIVELSHRLAECSSALAQERHEKMLLEHKIKALEKANEKG